MTQRGPLVASLLIACMCVGGTVTSTSYAQKDSVPKRPDIVAIGSQNTKELLALMDTDKNGKISKQEWMKFMEAEFDRLDTRKKGEIDPKELLKSNVSLSHATTTASITSASGNRAVIGAFCMVFNSSARRY